MTLGVEAEVATAAEEEEGLSALLEANGLTIDDLDKPTAPIERLEMFLQEYPKMVGLNRFPNLITLKLIDQCIKRIEGLSSCPQLQKLWLMENKISQIQGLEACTCLQELFLYSNRITAITGLDHLTQLQVLWLADNYITSLSGLSRLGQLKQLNMARNDISSIGSALLSNTALTSINLADNKISCFQDVAGVAKIKGLQELSLADPFWGSSPVAGLCNYQTYMLYLLPQLISLDTLLLAEETKAAAYATVTKKQLYYNMRIRTLRRAAYGLVQQAKVGCKKFASRWVDLHGRLACAAKSLQRQLQYSDGSNRTSLQGQLDSVDAAMHSIASRQQGLDNTFARDMSASAAGLNAAVSRLQLELSSGGNIRLEEARPTDSWLAFCRDLVKSRLIQAGESGGGLGVTDIQVLSIAKVHNRHLRVQFERSQNNSGGGEIESSQPCSDYMFYGEHPALPGELMRVVQAGFRAPAEYSSLGLDAAVRVSSCVNLADQFRLQYTLEQAQAAANAKDTLSSGCNWPEVLEGQLLLCKVLLGGVLQEAEGHVQLMNRTGGRKSRSRDGQLHMPSLLDGKRVDQTDFKGASAVYRTSVAESDEGANTSRLKGDHQQALPQHKVWYVFDSASVLPEYLVRFRYTTKAGSALATACAAFQTEAVTPATNGLAVLCSISQTDPLLKLCAWPLLPWLAAAQDQEEQHQGLDQSCNGSQTSAESREMMHCKSLTAAVEQACPELHLSVLTATALAPFTSGRELATLTHLSLHKCGLSSCESVLDHLPCLRALVLSFNNLTTLEDLASSVHPVLASLDVSHNRLEGWKESWLASVPALTSLDASHNQLADVALISQLSRSTPRLQQIDLRGNPVQHHKAYHLQLSTSLQQLAQLDGVPMMHGSCQAGTVDAATLIGGTAKWHSETGPMTTQPEHSQAHLHAMMHTVVLEGKNLHSLAGIGVASQLVCANLADNLLTGLVGLQACSLIRELNLSRNQLTELNTLCTLSSLRQLDLSLNHISSLTALSCLTGLSQLNVEGNQLTSLQGVTAMQGLMELYAAGNAVADIKEAERLAVLPHLVILDLVDNPLVSACEGYRLLLLYRLRHLKVLDGVPAEPTELAAARAKYSGRLTLSFLEEQLGSSCSLSTIRGLDVSGLRIKDVGVVFSSGSPFSSLTELVLDNNQISCVTPLGGLSGLAVLKLSYNRLGDADAAAASFAVQANPAEAVECGAVAAQGVGACGAAGQQSMTALLPQLQVLHIAGNGLTSLKPLQLQYTTGLRSLFVQENELQRLDGLEGLVQLTELVADKNRLRHLEFEALNALVCLRKLHVEDDLVKNLISQPSPAGLAGVADRSNNTPAGCLPSLQVLHLAGNRLVDAADLDRLAGLAHLVEVSLAGNPLARKQTYRLVVLSRCPCLEVIDKQAVTVDERTYAENALSLQQETLPLPLDAAAGWLAAAADARQSCWPSSMVAGPAAAGGGSGRSVPPAAAGKVLPGNLPAVVNCDAFAQLAINVTSNPLQLEGKGGVQLSSVVSSVPSIQSGVLVLSGAAAFGLEGLSYGNGSSGLVKGSLPAANSPGNGRQRPGSGKRPSAVGAAQQNGSNNSSSAVRRVVGHSGGSGSPVGGGFPVRQVAYRGY